MEHLEERRRAVRVRLKIAQAQWEKARDEVRDREVEHLNGLTPAPDGLQALRTARLRLGLSGAQYRQILQEFTEVVLREEPRLSAAPKLEGD